MTKKTKKLITVQVDEEVREEFKRITDENGVSMAKWIKIKIQEYIKDNK